MKLLLIIADDIGPGDVRTYRGTHATPLLSAVARRGARFWNAWATPLCVPTRAGLMTGLYGPRTGHVSHVDNLAEAQRLDAAFARVGTIAHALRGLGYKTAVAGKWQHGVSPAECGFDHSFTWDRWNPDGEVYPRYWGSTLWLDGTKMTLPADAYGPDVLADWTIDFLGAHDSAFVLHNELLAHLEGGKFLPTPDDPVPSLKGSIVYWTKIVDRVVEALPDTLIIIMSDNGAEAGAKREATAEGAACILIVVGPGVVPGERHQMVDVTDHYATIGELAGATTPCGRDGVSYVRALASPSAPGREWIYSWLDDKDMVRTATRAREGDGTVIDLETSYFSEIIQGIR